MLNHEELIQILHAVGEPMRLQIIMLLCKHERLNVSEIASRFYVTRPAISHHLKVMRNAGVVFCEKTGQEIYYWLNKTHLTESLRKLADSLEEVQDTPSKPDP